MYKDYDCRERDRERRDRDREYRERDRERDRGDYRDRDLDREIGRERDIDRERYKIREDRERDKGRDRYRESSRERIRELDRERNRPKNREINKDSDIIRGKNNDDDYIGRKMREEDLYRYKERDDYRKSLSRGYSRRRSRSRGEGQRMRRERGDRRRNSYSRKSNSRHSHRNEIIDQTIKDGIRQIEEAESFDRTVLMYSFPNEVNEKKIFNFFATNDVLPVIDIKLLRDARTNRSKNCCYVEFDTKDRAKQAISLSGQLLCGQPCQIVSSQAEKNRQALAFRLKKEKDKEKNPGGLMNNIVKYSTSNEQIDLNDAPMKIYVGGLTENLANITEDDLCNIFGFGDIDSIELHKDPITGRSKGYAFIQFHRASKAKEVIQAMNGFIYQGKALKVGEANENNTVIKGKMYVAQQQQQQQLQQQQLQQQMQMMKQQQINQQGQEVKENIPQQEIN